MTPTPETSAGHSGSPVNVAVVGLGFMGVTHLQRYLDISGARIAAICDSVRLPADGVLSVPGSPRGDKPLALDLTQVKAYREFDALLADPEIDLVDLCVPTPLHPKLAVAALQSGKHVICEKPLARTSALGREIVVAAAKANGFFMPAMVLRFWPEWAWVKAAIDRGNYGKVLAARFRRVSSPPAWSRSSYLKGAESGGALLDLHIHDTDFVQYCFGRPRSVFSVGTTHLSGAIDHVLTAYGVDGGIPVTAEGSWLMSEGFGFDMSYTVNFDRATADYDHARGPEALRLYEEGRPPRVLSFAGDDGYAGELRHMIEAIGAGKPPTIVTARDGLSAVEICEAEEKSIRLRQSVRLSEEGSS